MSRLSRLSVYALSSIAFPVAAAFLGLRSLNERDHPPVPPILDKATVAAIPRPAIDSTRPTVVVLLGTDLTEITDALAPYEMFARAGKYNVVTAAAVRQPSLLTGGLRTLPHYSIAEIDAMPGRGPAVVVVPNLPNAGEPLNRPVIEWIRKQAFAGALIHSWCKGAMALAETGLLDGQTATAHWGDIDALEKRYPKVTWVRGVRWIDRGQYVMSAGITSGIDASLRVLIRMAGDSVARRVAREIRYPNFHFALDPTVEQYSLRAADLVLVANAAFRVRRPLLGIAMYDGVGEIDLSNVYDAHGHTMVVQVETLAQHEGPVVTAHGLTVYPSLVSTATGRRGVSRLRDLDRLVVPGPHGKDRGSSLVGSLAAALPELGAEYIHVSEPGRFGLEAVIEDLARKADVPTARFALKRMEYRSSDIQFDGPRIAWVPFTGALVLAVGGFALATVAVRLTRRLSENDRKTSETSLPRIDRVVLP